MKYAFWNNKGGTGKTSLSFQTILKYSEKNPNKNVLVIDLCPQANLTELLLGGLVGHGSKNLQSLYGERRQSVGGYFQDRLPSAYTIPKINSDDYIVKPNSFNESIDKNISLLAGDPIIELQTNAIATLANTQLPGTDTWIAVINWITDFINLLEDKFDTVFIDCNPSFSIYTQIALSSVDRIILPVMADDSSRRALQNAFSLIYGIEMPSSIYQEFSFSSKLKKANRELPRIQVIVKNRLTQYMGTSSAYQSVLLSIDADIKKVMKSHPNIFSFSTTKNGIVDIRDFGTTGVIAFAEGKPFSKVNVGKHIVYGRETQISSKYLEDCDKAIVTLLERLD